jgi:hypothetical protein
MGKVNTVLNERDIEIFELINKFGWLREDYLAKYLGFNWGDEKVKNNLNTLAYRLSRHEFIVKKKIIEGYPAYWSLGKYGAEFLNTVQEKKIVLMTLRHNDLVADLAVDMLVRAKTENRKIELVTELELKRELYGAAAKKKKLPDLVIDGKHAIEVEISKKPDNRLATILAHYSSIYYETVTYYTNSKGIACRVLKFASNQKISCKLFQDLDILNSKNYNPEKNIVDDVVRDEAGQFSSYYERKLKELELS